MRITNNTKFPDYIAPELEELAVSTEIGFCGSVGTELDSYDGLTDYDESIW